jgi:hypothetical protein
MRLGQHDLGEIEKILLRWMRWGLLTPAISGVVLCAAAVALFVADGSFRAHEAVLIAMLAVGGILLLGAAFIATWRPENFGSYLSMHSEIVEAASAERETESG